MKYVFISDLHIKEPGDPSDQILKQFIEHQATKQSDKIVFLGDIFEFLVGEHQGYTKKFELFFTAIVEMLNAGKHVIFVEGNHDFHFQKTIESYLKTRTENFQKFEYLKQGREIELGGKRYLYCHGYEVDYHNKYFKRWYRVYTSLLFNILVSYILSFKMLQKLGVRASGNSKRRGEKSFNYEKMKLKYLEGAKLLLRQRGLDGVIAGHTHVESFHTFENGDVYLNCGLPAKHGHFIHYNGTSFEKINYQS